jgi:hypothetical protein
MLTAADTQAFQVGMGLQEWTQGVATESPRSSGGGSGWSRSQTVRDYSPLPQSTADSKQHQDQQEMVGHPSNGGSGVRNCCPGWLAVEPPPRIIASCSWQQALHT